MNLVKCRHKFTRRGARIRDQRGLLRQFHEATVQGLAVVALQQLGRQRRRIRPQRVQQFQQRPHIRRIECTQSLQCRLRHGCCGPWEVHQQAHGLRHHAATAGAARDARLGRRGGGQAGIDGATGALRGHRQPFPLYAQTRRRQTNGLRNPFQQQFAEYTVRCLRYQRHGGGRETRPSVGMAQVMTGTQFANKIFGKWQGVGKARFKRCAPLGPDQRVRIVPFGQKQETQRATIARLGQRIAQRAPGGPASGPISVEAEHDFADQAKGAFQMLRCRRGT